MRVKVYKTALHTCPPRSPSNEGWPRTTKPHTEDTIESSTHRSHHTLSVVNNHGPATIGTQLPDHEKRGGGFNSILRLPSPHTPFPHVTRNSRCGWRSRCWKPVYAWAFTVCLVRLRRRENTKAQDLSPSDPLASKPLASSLGEE